MSWKEEWYLMKMISLLRYWRIKAFHTICIGCPGIGFAVGYLLCLLPNLLNSKNHHRMSLLSICLTQHSVELTSNLKFHYPSCIKSMTIQNLCLTSWTNCESKYRSSWFSNHLKHKLLIFILLTILSILNFPLILKFLSAHFLSHLHQTTVYLIRKIFK